MLRIAIESGDHCGLYVVPAQLRGQIEGAKAGLAINQGLFGHGSCSIVTI